VASDPTNDRPALAAPVLDTERAPVGEVTLAAAIFDAPVREHLLQAMVVRQQARHRRGTASTKTRGEVAGSNKKPWRQKGTGRARAGSRTSPLWRGGGIVFGPKPHDYDRGMNKKERRQALCAALTLKRREGRLLILERFSVEAIKTKALKALLEKLNLSNVLIVVAEPDERLSLSARNLPGVKVLLSAGINVRDVLSHQDLVLTRAAVDKIQEALL
jgi:large subunit ribosomal protein L4